MWKELQWRWDIRQVNRGIVFTGLSGKESACDSLTPTSTWIILFPKVKEKARGHKSSIWHMNKVIITSKEFCSSSLTYVLEITTHLIKPLINIWLILFIDKAPPPIRAQDPVAYPDSGLGEILFLPARALFLTPAAKLHRICLSGTLWVETVLVFWVRCQ